MLATIGYAALAFSVHPPALQSASVGALRTTNIALAADTGSFTFTLEELSQIEKELETLRSENAELQGKIEGVTFSQEDLDLIGKELATLESDKEALQNQVRKMQDEKKALMDELRAKETEMTSLASDKEVLQGPIKAMEEEKQALMSQLQAKELELKEALEARKVEPVPAPAPVTAPVPTQDPKAWPEDAALGPLSSAARIDELERQVEQLKFERAKQLDSSRRHLDTFKASIRGLEADLKAKEVELSTAQFHLDRTEEMLSLTQESYEKFRGRSTLKLLAYGMDRDLEQLSKTIKGKYGSLTSKIGTLRRRLWLSSVGGVDAPVAASAHARSLAASR